jgi:hypothetical protein
MVFRVNPVVADLGDTLTFAHVRGRVKRAFTDLSFDVRPGT